MLVVSFQEEQAMTLSRSKKTPKPRSWDINKTEFVDSNGDRWVLSVEFKTVKGRVAPAALLIEPLGGVVELKTELLQELSIQKIVKPWIEQEQMRLARHNFNRQVKAHSGRPHSDDELQSVANVYRIAYAKSLPVQQTVAKTLGIPLSTAAKRIMAARRQGRISQTMNRRRSA